MSTEKMEEEESKQEFKDTEEMVQWKSIDQGVIQKKGQTLSETIEEEVLEKCKVEIDKRGREEHTKEEVSRRSGKWFRGSKISTSKMR